MKMNAKMYFLGVLAPPEVNEKILQWKYYMRDHFGCVVALRSPAHITLIPPFWMKEEMEEDLIKDVNSFSIGQQEFQIELQDFDAFKPRVIFAQVNDNPLLSQLQASFLDYLIARQKFPIEKESRPFHPHLTIANRDLLKKDFAPAFDHFKRISYHYRFPVNEIALLKNQSAKWEVIKKIPFSA